MYAIRLNSCCRCQYVWIFSQKVGGYVVDPAPLRHPRPNVPFSPAAEGPQGAPNVEVEAMEAAAGADGGRGANDGPEAEKPDEP